MTKQEILAIAKPILFNGEMVQAILEDRKTETRRVAKELDRVDMLACRYVDGDIQEPIGYPVGHTSVTRRAPYQPDDLLYVRETFFEHRGHFYYKADKRHEALAKLGISFKWRPSIHMPKEAARLFLRVKSVRAERVQEIDDSGCEAEGIRWTDNICQDEQWTPTFRDPDSGGEPSLIKGFSSVWDSTIKPADLPLYGWDANPWVWVIEFERVTPDD